MAHLLSLTLRALAVGALVMVAAIAARQVYLRMQEEETAPFGADDDVPAMMLARCESVHSKLQGPRGSKAGARTEEMVRAIRCIDS